MEGGDSMEGAMENTILKELREFRAENNKRWGENEKRFQENAKVLSGMDDRISALEKGRKRDRNDLLEILDTMQKMINSRFIEMSEHFDAKFDKIFVSQRVNDIEHEEFKKLVCAHEKRLNFYNSRITRLEEWKDQFDIGEFTAV